MCRKALIFVFIFLTVFFDSALAQAPLHDFSYFDSKGNKITIAETYKFQTTLDTGFIISNLTGRHFDPIAFDSTDQKFNYYILEIKKVKAKKRDAKYFDMYDLRVGSRLTTGETKEIIFSQGFRHFLMVVSKKEGVPKINRVFWLNSEI